MLAWGWLSLTKRHFEAAAGEFARAVQLDKSNDEAIEGLGRAQEELHLPADAERTYRAAIESRPDYFMHSCVGGTLLSLAVQV